MGGVLRLAVGLHVMAGLAAVAGVAYVFLLPRVTSPSGMAFAALGGIGPSSAVVFFHVPPSVRSPLCRPEEAWARCEGVWVLVRYRPLHPTPHERTALAASEFGDGYFDTGFFRTEFEHDFNRAVPVMGLRPDTEYELGAMFKHGTLRLSKFGSRRKVNNERVACIEADGVSFARAHARVETSITRTA